MRPILYAKTERTFTRNGLGTLDPVSCVVTEERNGLYELECVVPDTSPHFSDIENGCILRVIPFDDGSMQAFRIYKINEAINGLVTLYARHITYDLSYNTIMPVTASSVSLALSALQTSANLVETNYFTYWTDKTALGTFKVEAPQTVRSCLGGSEGSILDVYGGEFMWDNFIVRLYNQRGSDRDVTLKYGKNITDLNQENNLENVVTGVVPFWLSDETLVTLPEKSVDSAYASSYPFKRTVPLDMTSYFQQAPSQNDLRTAAQNYILENDIGLPKINITVSFVPLWKTEEYKDIAYLERVKLCDTVGVEFEKYGISTRAKVIKTVWDVLAERYVSIELGEAKSTFSSTIHGIEQKAKEEVVEATTVLQNAIENATETISGNKGGYVVFRTDSDGKPYELLIMNTADVTTATKVWRFNQSGWGYSSNGIGGPYTIAATQDGAIVADFITTGSLNANIIKAGAITDTGGNMSINVATGQISAKKLSVNSTNFTLAENGTMTANGATIVGEFKTRFSPQADDSGIFINGDTIMLKAVDHLGNDVTAWSISPVYDIDGAIDHLEIVINNDFTINGYTGYTGMLGSHYCYKGFVTTSS